MKINHIKEKLNKLIKNYKSHDLTWSQAQDGLIVSEIDQMNWDDIFRDIGEYRWTTLHEPKQIKIYSPGQYFPAISLTGNECEMQCEHCNKKYLKGMHGATTQEELEQTLLEIYNHGAKGVLISGGCDAEGKVPILNYCEILRKFKEQHSFYYNSHVGLISPEDALKLSQCGIDMVSFDLIFDQQVISDVFHLSATPQDYINTYNNLKKTTIDIVPHILVGANFGKIGKELDILQFLSQDPPNKLIFISMIPPRAQGKYDNRFKLLAPQTIGLLILFAHYFLPSTEISLGCMRLRGKPFKLMEKWGILSGLSRIEIPSRSTIQWLEKNQFNLEFYRACCGVSHKFEKNATTDSITGKLKIEN